MYILKTQHAWDSPVETEVFNELADAITEATKFFESYGFKIVDGRAHDPGCDDFEIDSAGRRTPKYTEYAFNVFDDVQIVKDGVMSFKHAEGEGPSCSIKQARVH
ncbi:MAG: hypothetical protein ACXABY_14055 [Candidatus Thorarchaeota archaeon]|jgi:hypothetical protein